MDLGGQCELSSLVNLFIRGVTRGTVSHKPHSLCVRTPSGEEDSAFKICYFNPEQTQEQERSAPAFLARQG